MSATANSPQPVLIISMGVSGCGKSTLAKVLADRFGFTFLEADDFHSAENVAHMAAGKPLTDTMREPWIAKMCSTIKDKLSGGQSCVLAYSGLRRAHRQKFRELGFPVLYIHLHGDKEIIRLRMESRTDHYMPAGLLDSQYAALDATDHEADIVPINIKQPIPVIVEHATTLVKEFVEGR